MRVTSTMSSNNAIYNINLNRQKIDHLNEQIATGLNVSKPSLDPVATSKILSLETQSKTVDQYISNIKSGQLWLKIEGNVLEGVQKNVMNIKGIASASVGTLTDPYKRSEALDSLRLYRDQLLDLPNAGVVGDQYIFSGFKGDSKPFETSTITANSTAGSTVLANIDTTNLHLGMPISGPGIPDKTIITAIPTPGVGGSVTLSNAATATAVGGNVSFSGAFTGTDDPFQIEINQGMKLSINVTGGNLLRGGTPPGSSGVDIVKTLDQLILDISNGNQAGVTSAVSTLDKANKQVMGVVSEVGMRVSRLDNALSYQERSNDVFKTLLANLQEVDMAKAAVELTSQKTAFDATLSATAKILPLSLLDYL